MLESPNLIGKLLQQSEVSVIEDPPTWKKAHGVFFGQIYFNLLLVAYIVFFQQDAQWLGQMMVYFTCTSLAMIPMWFIFKNSNGADGPFLNFYKVVQIMNEPAFVVFDVLLWQLWRGDWNDYNKAFMYSLGAAQTMLCLTIVAELWYHYSMSYVYGEYVKMKEHFQALEGEEAPAL